MPLLDDVTEAAKRYGEAEEQRQQAREQLRAKVRAARDEGIPFAAIARAAGSHASGCGSCTPAAEVSVVSLWSVAPGASRETGLF